MVSKGEETRRRVIDCALRMASRDGLGGLTLSSLAGALDMSKSGLFAHFTSKEDLQASVLSAASTSFEGTVVRPAIKAARGAPRLVKLFDNWLRWAMDPAMPGGCIFMAASIELDDRLGPLRELLVSVQEQLRQTIIKAARLAVEAGHFRRDLDCEQVAFDMFAITFGFNHARRLLGDPRAESRARVSFERLLASARA